MASTAPDFSTAWRRASSGGQARAKIVSGLQREMFFDLRRQSLIVSPPRARQKRSRLMKRFGELSCQVLRFDLKESANDCGRLLPIQGFGRSSFWPARVSR